MDCGAAVRVFLTFSGDEISGASFASNGCGWAVASADALAEAVIGVSVRELRGLEDAREFIAREIGDVSVGREQCVEICVEALRKALADRREQLVEEWSGDEALICSCFGVSEAAIENAASAGTARTLEDVGDLCGAGTGCGSCRMLIAEILESRE